MTRGPGIAVVGSGIAGLTAAPHAKLTLFEADDRPGGHADHKGSQRSSLCPSGPTRCRPGSERLTQDGCLTARSSLGSVTLMSWPPIRMKGQTLQVGPRGGRCISAQENADSVGL
jgi:hypothetical protein